MNTVPASSPYRRNMVLNLAGAVACVVAAIVMTACGADDSEKPTADAAAVTTTTEVAPVTTTTEPVVRPSAAVDELVAIDGGRLHIHCDGSGATTVLLVAGWDAGGDESWAEVQPTIAKQSRVCTYDRFGTGTSDAPATTQTFTSQAADLYALLAAAGEPGPYVVAAHSFGGAEAVAFASQYRDEVAGLLLVDATPTTWPAAVCAVPDDGTEAAQLARTLCGAYHDPAQDAERLDAVAAFGEVAAIDTLGDLPVTVVTAAHRTWPGLAADQLARLDGVWADGVAHWSALSSNSKTVTVENTGHYIQVEHPDVVVDVLTQLLEASGSR